jgi:hypothetical protein
MVTDILEEAPASILRTENGDSMFFQNIRKYARMYAIMMQSTTF